MATERLHKVLARAGLASRRDCEAMIADGRVAVNGSTVREMGVRIDPEADVVLVDGQPLPHKVERVYYLLHKPLGVVSTVDDPQGRPTVVSLVDSPTRVFPVGRLDIDSEGLLLLTNDGELTHRLTHPAFEVEKEYHALLDRPPSEQSLREWSQGVLLYNRLTARAHVERLDHPDSKAWVRIVLHEGRKRQIREVARSLGYTVLRLIRVREGSLRLGGVAAGSYRTLTSPEIAKLREYLTIPPSAPHLLEPASPEPGNAIAPHNGTPEHRPPGHAPQRQPNTTRHNRTSRNKPNDDRRANTHQRQTSQHSVNGNGVNGNHRHSSNGNDNGHRNGNNGNGRVTLDQSDAPRSRGRGTSRAYEHYRRYRDERSGQHNLTIEASGNERPAADKSWQQRQQFEGTHNTKHTKHARSYQEKQDPRKS